MILAMQGRLDPCFLLSYAVSEKALGGLRPLTHQGFAFLNIVVSRILRMRPAGIPPVLGLTYWHIAYRVHVRADLASDEAVAGLYFLRSEVDRSLLVIPGNALTDFRFHKASIRTSVDGTLFRLEITGTPDGIADAEVIIETIPGGKDEGTPSFRTLGERERILKYAPLGLSVDRSGRELKVAEVLRDESGWEERRVRVRMAEWEYLQRTFLGEARLVRATQVMPIDYRWRIGRLERLSSGYTQCYERVDHGCGG
jgi:hypothetical protein